jgi:CDP-diacylglycerol--glycerol-3-phosphate 3-phosphatidyltransferase
MSIANRLTFLRIILTPVFFLFYFFHKIPFMVSYGAAWTVPVIYSIYFVSEVTDFFDGLVARKLKETSDFGKLFDPFADTLMQLTCFLCFILDGIYPGGLIIPSVLFLLVVYREFSILFIRNLMLRKGITLGARISGKLKTLSYIAAGSAALIAVGVQRLSLFENLFPAIQMAAWCIFILSVAISVISFIDYLIIFLKAPENKAA